MKLYTPNNWFDVDRLCNDDVQFHKKKNLLVDYESYENLENRCAELEAWILEISNHDQIPEWIKQSAKSLLCNK